MNLLVLLGSVSFVFGAIHIAIAPTDAVGHIHLWTAFTAPLVLLQLRLGIGQTLCVAQFMALITLSIAAASFLTGGILSPAMAWMAIVPMFGLALDRRRTAVLGASMVVASIVAMAALSIAELAHPITMPSPYKEVVISLGLAALAGSLIVLGVLSENTRYAILQQLEASNTSLSREVAEHTATRARLQRTHRQLVDSARVAGAAEVATGVLHNLGNALNAVNVSASLLDAKAASMRLDRVRRLEDILTDDRAKKYVASVHDDLARTRTELRTEIEAMQRGVNHATATVAAQQRHAGRTGVLESIALQELLDDALLLSTHRHDADTDVIIDCHDVPRLVVDRHRLVQIVTNLVNNAHDAVRGTGRPGRVAVRGRLSTGDSLQLSVSDNGVGIDAKDINRVFAHGFTTKEDGHGFGLHACALSAQEVGGSLRVASDGPGTGATFTLTLPVQIARGKGVAG